MSRNSLFHLKKNATGSLQSQIKEILVEAILNGHLTAGNPLPSGRKLAKQLGVGRNTVVIAYQDLVDEGFLISKERSGHYVNQSFTHRVFKKSNKVQHTEVVTWLDKLKVKTKNLPYIYKSEDWRNEPYPFIYGQFDPSLFPIADWRECVRETVAISAIHNWAGDRFDRDDELLTDQIRSRLLTRRGIWVDNGEILITSGTQHAQYIISQLLIDNQSVIGMEEPGYFDARNVLGLNRPTFKPIIVDQYGMVVDEEIDGCDLIYTTPSHHSPTTVTLPLSRREKLLKRADENNIVIIEDDYETENNFIDKPLPALKSLDKTNHVLYIGSLSKTLAPGLRLGYLVGPKEFIDQARSFRRIMMRHMPANNQQIVALFIKRGHYDSLINRMHNEFKERWQIMNRALHDYLSSHVKFTSTGGTSFWIQGKDSLDVDVLEQQAAKLGILIEGGSVFFMNAPPYNKYFRLGYSSIDKQKIQPGIKLLSGLIKQLS